MATMATFDFQMEGIEELENDIRTAIEECPKQLKKGLNDIANDFRKSARKRTPDRWQPKLNIPRSTVGD